MNIKLIKYSVYVCLLGCIGCKNNDDAGSEIKQAIDVKDNYTVFKTDTSYTGVPMKAYTTTLDDIPFSGTAANIPWTNVRWPANKSGIAYRWNDPITKECVGQVCFSYKSPTLEALKSNPAQISTLSPAEKYSIYVGDYSYALVNFEREYRLARGWESPDWEGLDHGWAPASMNYIEPKRITMPANLDGLVVEFKSDDIKALLSYNQGEGLYPGKSSSFFISPRCNIDFSLYASDRKALAKVARSKECRGVNPADLHLVLANHIGINRKGFVADMIADDQVSRKPVYSFHSHIVGIGGPSSTSAPGTVKEVEIMTTIEYMAELDKVQNDALGANNIKYKKYKTYRYRLEVDANERLLGGEYRVDVNSTNQTDFYNLKNGLAWPDFLLINSSAPFEKTVFTYGDRTKNYPYDMRKLQEIYNAATK